MIFDKPKIVLFIKRQSMQIVDSSGKIHELKFPEEIVRELEIINHGNFVKLVGDFIRSLKISKVEAIVVFAKELLFEKFIENAVIGSKEAEESFFSQVPFEKDRLLSKSIQEQKGVRLVCTNGDFIKTFRLAFKVFGIKISAVVPSTIYAISGGGNAIGVADALAISRSKLTFETGNFISGEASQKKKPKDEDENAEETAEDEDKVKIWKNQKVLLAFGIAMIAGAVILIGYSLGLVKNPWAKAIVKVPVKVENSSNSGTSQKNIKNVKIKTETESKTGEASASSAQEASSAPILVP